MAFPDGNICWALSSSQYVLDAIKNIEANLKSKGVQFKESNQPTPSAYRPE
jgi:hypothetical protein